MLLKKDILLKEHSNYEIGGRADYFFEFKSTEELKTALLEYRKIDPNLKSVFILGKGTNILFSDDGFRGLILKNSLRGISFENEMTKALSGTLMQDLVDFAMDYSLSGLEWAGGLPGTVGGAIRGNAGAFGGEIKDDIFEVQSFDLISLKTIKRKNYDCKFDYRKSVFKTDNAKNEIIISGSFKLKKGNKEQIEKESRAKIDYRILKHPLDYPNIGSIFKNIPLERVPKNVAENYKNYIKNDPFPVLPVAKLIAESGIMGKRVGGAQISEKHPNFIVNLGSAKANDVLQLIEVVKKQLKSKYQVSLEEEIMII